MNDLDATPNGPVLYRAPYVVPVTSPLIADGGVLVNAGRIVAVDSFVRLRGEAARVVELDERILTPALINCHAHLELSHLASLGRESEGARGEITAWISNLLAQREAAILPAEIIRAGREALAALSRRGVALVCDIGNHAVSLAIADGAAVEVWFFQELLGVTAPAAQAALATVGNPPSADSPGLGRSPVAPQLTAHAPYSCHPSLLQALKERARQAGRLFPIHVAESAAEIEFLATGHGPFQQFLTERLRQFGALAEGQALSELVPSPGCGAVEWLHKLGLLDAQTICVHAVHISPAEADLLAQSKAKVCLCPASNRRLGVGIAQVAMLIERQILPGLGTDSLASNDCLDLWHEMQVLQEDHPGLAPELIFRLATLGGAGTLGVAARLGSLAPGREAKLLAVDFSGSAAAVYPFLANTGQAIRLDWLEAANVSRG